MVGGAEAPTFFVLGPCFGSEGKVALPLEGDFSGYSTGLDSPKSLIEEPLGKLEVEKVIDLARTSNLMTDHAD